MSTTSTYGYWNWTGYCVVTFTYDFSGDCYSRKVLRP